MLSTRSISATERVKKIVAAIEELVAKAGKTQARRLQKLEVDHAYASELDAKVGARLKDALDTKAHAEGRKLRNGQGNQG